MGRLIDENELEKYIMHDGCEKGCGYIDERDLKFISTAEAIPKADYETRLKADMVAILDEFDLRLYEQYEDTDLIKVKYIRQAIQQKINALKGEGEK